MRQIAICLMLLSLPLAVGCKDKEKATVVQEHLRPTGREREILEVHRIDPDSDLGQQKIRKLRERQAKLEAAEERMRMWAEEAAKREAEEAEQ